jgi:hypothetical protein
MRKPDLGNWLKELLSMSQVVDVIGAQMTPKIAKMKH